MVADMNKLSILLNIILKMHFETSYCLMHLHSYGNDTQISNFVEISLWDVPIYVVNTSDYNEWNLDDEKYCRDFLITSKEPVEALLQFEQTVKMTGVRGYNNRRYIVLLENDDVLFGKFFNSSALHYIRDILVIIPRKENVNSNECEDYLLYTHKYVGIDNNQQPILLDIWHCANESFQKLNGWQEIGIPKSFVGEYDFFPDKVKNLFGRFVDTPFFNIPPYAFSDLELGSEYNVVKFFLQKYNMSFKDSMDLKNKNLNQDTLGMAYVNWTGYGIRGALLLDNPEESVDMSFGGNLGGEIADLLYDMVTVVHYGVSAIVPGPKKEHGWTIILKTFKFPIWIFYGIAYASLYLLISCRLKYENYSCKCKQLNLIAYYGFILNQPLTNTKYRVGLRYLLAITLILSLLFLTMFSSRLLSTLVVPVYTDNIQTVEELAKSDLTLVSTINYFDIIYTDERPLYRKLYNQVNYILNYNVTEDLFTQEKYAFGIIKHDTGFITSDCVDLFFQENVNHYQFLKDDIFKWNTYIVLRKNSVISPQLELVVQRAREAGLLRFWEFEIFLVYNVTLTLMKLKDTHNFDAGVFQLQLVHVKGAFGVLFTGLSLAFAAFVKETNPCITKILTSKLRSIKRLVNWKQF